MGNEVPTGKGMGAGPGTKGLCPEQGSECSLAMAEGWG